MNNTEILSLAHSVFNAEIAGINAVAKNLSDQFVSAVKLLYTQKDTGRIILLGIGKSGHVAKKIAATLSSTGSSAFFVHLAEASHGDLGMINPHDTVIIISYSGLSDELIPIFKILKIKGNKIIFITGNSDSLFAKQSDVVLNVKIDIEACHLGLAPTTSTTATLVLGDALAVCLSKIKNFKAYNFALSHPGGSLGRKLLITVEEIMYTGNNIPIVYSKDSINQVIHEINRAKLGFCVVLHDNNNKDQIPIGIITDGDIRRMIHDYDSNNNHVNYTNNNNKYNSKQNDSHDNNHTNINLNLNLNFNLHEHTLLARDLMRKHPKTILNTASALSALEMMRQYKITALIVVNDHTSLVGAINIHNLFDANLVFDTQ